MTVYVGTFNQMKIKYKFNATIFMILLKISWLKDMNFMTKRKNEITNKKEWKTSNEHQAMCRAKSLVRCEAR